MKNIPILALGAILVASAGTATAGPLDFLFGGGSSHHDDHHDDHRDDHHDNHHRPSTEARAQQRLRELGYYRGPIDGSFGRGSRDSLARFQRDNRIRPSGQLDERTLRALRL